MSISTQLSTLKTNLNSIKTALETKRQGSTSGDLSTWSTAIASLSGDVPDALEGDVRFIDYDGTILHTYSNSAALGLTSLPPLPTHAGLVCQGWNYTLQEMKQNVTDCGACDVGAVFNTDDDKTRINIVLDSALDVEIPICFTVDNNSSVVLDWGDGSATESVSSAGQVTKTHTYSPSSYPASYTITLEATSGTFRFNTYLFGNQLENYKKNNVVRFVNLSSKVSNVSSTFYECTKLSLVTIADGVTSFSTGISSTRVRSLVIPKSCTIVSGINDTRFYVFTTISLPPGVNINNQLVINANALTRVCLPYTVTAITYNSSLFGSCYYLSKIFMSKNMTSVSAGAFSGTSFEGPFPEGCTITYSSSGQIYLYGSLWIKTFKAPDRITELSSSTLNIQNCRNMESFDFNNITSITLGSAFSGCYSLKTISIPEGVTSLPNSCFSNCFSLQNISLPSTLQSIGVSCFYYCPGLSSIVIPDAVQTLQTQAFAYCYNLSYIRFPANLTEINGSSVFVSVKSGCVYDFRACNSVPTLQNTNAFYIQAREIIVPDSLYDQWIAASNWSSTTNNIKGSIVRASESSLGPLQS